MPSIQTLTICTSSACFTQFTFGNVATEALPDAVRSFVCQPLTQCHTGSVITKLNDLLAKKLAHTTYYFQGVVSCVDS